MKSERGSITLFVLIAMIFFAAIAMAAYVSASNKIQGQNGELESMKAAYGQNISEEGLANLYEQLTTAKTEQETKPRVTNLTAGQYVKYTDANGDEIKCVVLYDTAYNEANNTNYGVQIITRNPVTTVTLGNGTGSTQSNNETYFNIAKNSYNGAIGTLNAAAETYRTANTNIASITSDARCVGSLPYNKSARNTSLYSHTAGTNDYCAGYDGQFEAAEEDAAYTATLNNIRNYTLDWRQLGTLDIVTLTDTTNASNYWLASRGVSTQSSETRFYIRTVNASNSLAYASTNIVWNNSVRTKVI